MEDRVVHFRLGLFMTIVVTALLTVFMVHLFGELPSMGHRELFVRFDRVPGVSEQTPVRKNGILIGRVKRLAPDDRGVVLVLSIEPKWKLTESDVCRITNANLFGDALLEFVSSGTTGASQREVEDGEYMTGMVAADPMDAMRLVVDMKEDFNSAVQSIRSAGEEVATVADSLNKVVAGNQNQIGRVLVQTEAALKRFDTAMVSVNQVVGNEDLQIALEEALEGVPLLVQEASKLLKLVRTDADQVLKSIDRVAVSAEENFENLRGLTKPLGEHGEEIAAKLNSSAGRLEDLLVNLQAFSGQLNEGDGTVGQFMNNPEIYQRLNRAARNVEELTLQLRPILADARVVMDKVARNPRMLGVQGALQRPGSGLK